MTTKIMPREGDSHQIPALGDIWAHVPASRVILSVDGYGERSATLYKASNKKEVQCSFQITVSGNIFELVGWLVGFLMFSSTTRLYRGRAPRQSV